MELALAFTFNVRSSPMASSTGESQSEFRKGEASCQKFESQDLVFRWTVLAQG